MSGSAISDRLRAAVEEGSLRPLDLQFGQWMGRLAGGRAGDGLILAAALASHRVGEGDVCLPLHALQEDEVRIGPAPSLAAWRTELLNSGVVGRPGAQKPLILDLGDRLYLARYYRFEEIVEQALGARLAGPVGDADEALLREGLGRLFSAREDTDWQRLAAAMAVLQSFCVISGGPGTGKTHTVTAILALLIEQAPARRIALAAPTGKAAARLTESIRAARAKLELPDALREAIPDEALTLHRLLGMRPGRAEPRYRSDHRLPIDVLVVDEASMVDLPLMARLLDALPTQARLILLGDRDQLASVEAGRVLGDLCGRQGGSGYSQVLRERLRGVTGQSAPAASLPAIGDHIALLRESRRFDAGSGIGALARAVNVGDGDGALTTLRAAEHADVTLYEPARAELDSLLRELIVPAYREYLCCHDPASALIAFNRFRVLCAVYHGPAGVDGLNREIEKALAREGLIHPQLGHYPGRPILVTQNDHALKLYNGDIGLILPDPDADGRPRAFFPTDDGVRRVLPTRLPPHVTVFAMTVHKSQGSEFDSVLLALPTSDSPLLTRELLYTGLTRARGRLHIWSEADVLARTTARTTQRTSGLWEKLWGEPG